MPRTYCPQLYEGTRMLVTPCNRCSNWNKEDARCDVYMGIEHVPLVAADQVPDCPMSESCQHQIQNGSIPCPVRARGFICESVVGQDHELAFNAIDFDPPDDEPEHEEYPCP